MYWEHYSEDDKDTTPIKTLYKFIQVDSDLSFNDWTIYAPEFPDDYIVCELHGDGYRKIIRNPGGVQVKKSKKRIN